MAPLVTLAFEKPGLSAMSMLRQCPCSFQISRIASG